MTGFEESVLIFNFPELLIFSTSSANSLHSILSGFKLHSKTPNDENKIIWHSNLSESISQLMEMNYVQVNYLEDSVSAFHISLTDSGARAVLDYHKDYNRPLIFKYNG